MRRWIPTYSYSSDLYAFGTDLTATNLRLVLGWHVSQVSIGLGGGVDWYHGNGQAAFNAQGLSGTQTVTVEYSSRRFLVFGDLAAGFWRLSFAAELGYQIGVTQELVTTFEGNDPADGHLFVGAGIKIAF